MSDRKQSVPEEIANTITHGLGIVFCMIATPFLILLSAKGNAAGTWAVSVFSFGMLMVYLSSTLYHAARNETTKRTLRIWDHISIFLLIAGSYTPIVYRYTDSATSTLFLSIMWGLVALGVVKKLFLTGRYDKLSLILYLAMGWMAVFIINPLIANMPASIFMYVITAGIFYSIGVVFYLLKRLQYHHAVWHVFVLAGTVTHFFAVYNSIPINIKV